MRIAQVAPLHEACPPSLYGGTEREVSYLTEELVELGHDVTLFASGDSRSEGRLVPGCRQALRLDSAILDPLVYHMVMFNRLAAEADQFDVLHFHTDYLHFTRFAHLAHPTLTTLHGRLDLPDLPVIFAEFPDMPLVSISDSQRQPIAWANWHATVPHGLPRHLYSLGSGGGGYLAFIGRISPEKRLDRAIDISRLIGFPLRIAAKIDKVDQDYFKEAIRPILIGPDIEYLGEISDAEKGAFLGEAAALLFPIGWPEPFGLSMIEAMANGTPTVAFRCGSVPEVIEDGVTGFIVDDVDAAVRAVPLALKLDRRVVRGQFEARFCSERMARDYLAVYESLLRESAHRPTAREAMNALSPA